MTTSRTMDYSVYDFELVTSMWSCSHCVYTLVYPLPYILIYSIGLDLHVSFDKASNKIHHNATANLKSLDTVDTKMFKIIIIIKKKPRDHSLQSLPPYCSVEMEQSKYLMNNKDGGLEESNNKDGGLEERTTIPLLGIFCLTKLLVVSYMIMSTLGMTMDRISVV